jgi:hypothetical protein
MNKEDHRKKTVSSYEVMRSLTYSTEYYAYTGVNLVYVMQA